MSFLKSETQLPQPHPDRMMADTKDLLEFLESGVRMFLDVNLEFVRVKFAPMTPARFGDQRPGLPSGQIAVGEHCVRPL